MALKNYKHWKKKHWKKYWNNIWKNSIVKVRKSRSELGKDFGKLRARKLKLRVIKIRREIK